MAERISRKILTSYMLLTSVLVLLALLSFREMRTLDLITRIVEAEFQELNHLMQLKENYATWYGSMSKSDFKTQKPFYERCTHHLKALADLHSEIEMNEIEEEVLGDYQQDEDDEEGGEEDTEDLANCKALQSKIDQLKQLQDSGLPPKDAVTVNRLKSLNSDIEALFATMSVDEDEGDDAAVAVHLARQSPKSGVRILVLSPAQPPKIDVKE
jgi:hypothetical protein